MNINEQITKVEAAAGDSRKLALAVLDIILASHPPEMRRVIEAAAVPRWFDVRILGAVLDEDLSRDADRWFEAALKLSAVEPLGGRKAWNVHETTRLALRHRLLIDDPKRLASLATRARDFFAGSGPDERIERAYHLVFTDPTGCGTELRSLNDDLEASPEQRLALAQALVEYAIDGDWNPATRGWAGVISVQNRWHYRPLEATISNSREALGWFEQCELLEGVLCSLIELGDALIERGFAGDTQNAGIHYQRALEISEKLLAANPESAQAARDVSGSLSSLAAFLSSRGLPGDAETAFNYYQRDLEISERLLAANPESARAARDVSGSLSSLAAFLSSRGLSGDAETAWNYYQRDLEISERLLAANPESAQAARDVSGSLSSLAAFLSSRGLPGDAETAFNYYQRDLEISERLLAANPESAQAARDVSGSLSNLAAFLSSRGLPGDAETAFNYYQRDLGISERLLAANPESAQTARDVSGSLSNLAAFRSSRGLPGDAETALNYYQRALEVRERLLAANPDSAWAAREVSWSLSSLAAFLSSRGLSGDAETALNYYQRALEVRERLLVANSESAWAAREVSWSLNNLAAFLASRGLPGDAETAFNYYQRALEVCEGLLAANPESAQAARDVSGSLSHLAAFLSSRGLPGDAETAWNYYQRDLEISERLLAANPESAQAARDVSGSLSSLAAFLSSRGLPGDAETAFNYYQRDLEISERLLAANPESARAARDVSGSLSSLAAFLSSRGLSGDAETAWNYYQRDLEISERLLAANPESAQAARDVSGSLSSLAAFLSSRGLPGDAETAFNYYQRDLEISERLLAANPESAQAARDVSGSLSNLAAFLSSRGLPGDAETAWNYYQRDLEISERLLAANPESAEAARDVSGSLSSLAAFLSSRGLPGDAETAWNYNQRALEISERLLAANPESAEAARDVSGSLSSLAAYLSSRGLPGDAETAFNYYQRALEISKRLLAANPESAQAARDVSMTLSSVAAFLSSRGLPGDVEEAFIHYTRDLEISERLLAANPESAQALRDVAISLGNLGDFLAGRSLPGDAEAALIYYQRSLEISEQLLAANPESARAGRDVSVSMGNLGDFLAGRSLPGDAEAALIYYQRSLEISEQLLAANPESAQAGREVSLSLITLADFFVGSGLPQDTEIALGYYQSALQISEGLLAADPGSAWAARTVSYACWTLGNMAEESGAADHAQWWLKAFDILDKMKREGRSLSQVEEERLEVLRRMLNP